MNQGPVKITFTKEELELIFKYSKFRQKGIKTLKDAYVMTHNSRPLFKQLTASILVDELESIINGLALRAKVKSTAPELSALLARLTDFYEGRTQA